MIGIARSTAYEDPFFVFEKMRSLHQIQNPMTHLHVVGYIAGGTLHCCMCLDLNYYYIPTCPATRICEAGRITLFKVRFEKPQTKSLVWQFV